MLPFADTLIMGFSYTPRKETETLLVWVFVFCAVVLAYSQNASASCGDYLRHSMKTPFPMAGHSLLDQDPFRQKPNEPSTPVSGCQSGNCRSAPPSVPVEPTRTVETRQQPKHFWALIFDFVPALAGENLVSDFEVPVGPSFAPQVPPPRAYA